MKQIPLLPKSNARREHGGTSSIGKRRSRRLISVKTPLHLVLKSDFAFGSRSLLRHRPLVDKIITKARKRFHIRVYETAVVSNHIHLVVKGYTRCDLQNFFRLVAGHIAQELLRITPILASERPKPGGAPAGREKDNKFWQSRIYSRVLTWGREYISVKRYVFQNAQEALGLIAYKARARRSLKFTVNTS